MLLTQILIVNVVIFVSAKNKSITTNSVINSTTEVDYCKMDCKDTFTNKIFKHSACNCKKASSCKNALNILDPSEKERQIIVNAHNTLRNKVASGMHNKRAIKGGATKMYALSYDYVLEHVAECWAIQCQLIHDKCRRTEAFTTVGQNFFTTIGQPCDTKIFLEAIDTWFDEVSGITLGCVLGHGSCMSVGHYTQLVWSKTTHVGCARIEMAGKICNVFCNYGPAGNKQGQPVYTIGPPGNDCIVKDSIHHNLCALIPLSRQNQDSGNVKLGNISKCLLLSALLSTIANIMCL